MNRSGPVNGGGSVSIVVSSGTAMDTMNVPAGGSISVDAVAGTTVTLTATADSGHAFVGWVSPSSLACADGTEPNVCALAAGLITADTAISAGFDLSATTLTVTAGANGAVLAAVGGASGVRVGAGLSLGFPYSVEATATLVAEPGAGHALSGWALSPGGLACQAAGETCMLAAGTAGPASAMAGFAAVRGALSLSVSGPAGANGWARAGLGGAEPLEARAGAGASTPTDVTALAGVELEAGSAAGYAFSGWTLSGGLSCAGGGPGSNPCRLEVDLTAAGSAFSAAAGFALSAATLTVTAGANGAVLAAVGGASGVRVGAGLSLGFPYSVEATATLVAEPGAGHALSGWALSPGGLACQAAGETCMLAAGTAGPASAMAGFAAVRGALSLSVSGPAGANGWARAGLGGAEPLEARAGAGASTPTDVTALAGVELEAGSAAGYAFSGWTLSGGLSCAGGGPGSNPCRLEVDLTAAGSAFSAAAGFALSAATLTVTAGANGAVLAAVGGASGVRVGAGLSLGFPYSVEATATLVAEPGAGHALSGWALSPGGLACQAAGETCMLAAGTAGPASAMAGFAAVRGALSLSVSGPAGANGWARAGLGGAEPLEARAGAGASTPTDVTALAGVELEAGSAAGYAFSGWTLSGGLSCAGGGPGSNPCRLEVDLTAAGSAFSAAAGFALSAATLTVTAGANGAVLAAVGGASGVRVGAGLSLGFPYSVEATATLVAEPGAGHALSGWALSPGGLACQAAGETCMLAAGTAGPASAMAGFAAVRGALSLSVSGPEGANGWARAGLGGAEPLEARAGAGASTPTDVTALAGVELEAGSAAGYAFSGWTLSGGLSCAGGGPGSNPCRLEVDLTAAGSAFSAAAGFALSAATLTVTAGANGAVLAAVGGASGVRVGAGLSLGFPYSVEATATLVAEPGAGHALSGWALSPGGLACQAAGETCMLAAGTAGPASAMAGFAAVRGALSLSVSGPEGANGWARAGLGGAEPLEARAGAGASTPTDVTALAGVELEAGSAAGYAFSGWTLSGGLSCAGGGPGSNPCRLEVDLTAAGSAFSAAAGFALSAATLTVTAGANGAVLAAVGGASGVRVGAGLSLGFPYSVEATATLVAEPGAGHALSGWALSPGGLACQAAGETCMLAAGTAGPASAMAGFAAVRGALSLSVSGPAGANGWARAGLGGAEPLEARAGAGASTPTDVTALAGVELEAGSAAGYAFSGWTLSGGLSCAGGGPGSNPCRLEVDLTAAGSAFSAAAGFALSAATLTVTAGANGAVLAAVGGASGVRVGAGLSLGFPYSVEATATLVAEPGAGHALSGWALSPGGLACQAAGETCMLAAGTAGPASAMAGFAAVRGALSLSVSGPAGANGWARAGLGGAEPLEARAGAGASTPTDVTALAGVELEAGSAAGYAFSGWTLSGGLSCAGGGPGSNPCRLEVDLTAAGSAFSAAAGFALSAATLTVTAGANGAVLAAVGGASGVRVGAGLSLGFPYSVEATATLVAEPGAGHALSGWALSPGGLACQAAGETCMLAAGTAGPASAMAGFAAVRGALSLSVSGPEGANGWARAGLGGAEPLEARAGAGASTPTDVTALAGVELEAGSAAGYAFSGWTLSGGLSCAGGGPGSNPCRLEVDLTAAGSAFSAAAGFALSAATLTVTAGANGAVLAAVGGASGVRVGAGLSLGFPYSVEATATLVAEPGAGHALSGWALSPGGLACQAAGETCMLAAGTAGPASAMAGFAAVRGALSLSVSGPEGANGWARAGLGGAEPLEARAGAGASTPTDVTALAGVELEAGSAAGYAFSGWTLSGGLSCAGGGPGSNPCRLEVDLTAAGSAFSAAAGFALSAATLTVTAGANGAVLAAVGGASGVRVGAGLSLGFPYSVEATATLVAEPGAGHALSGWALSPGGLACQAAGETCMLAAGTAGPASAMAGFAAVRGALSLSVSGPEGANGWARAGLGGAEPLEARAGAGASTPTDVTALAGVELEAGSAAGYAFSGWTLSGGLSCAGGGPGSNPCRLEVDLTAAGSAFSAAAGFALSAATLTVTAGANGAVLAAVGGASGVRVGAGLSLGFPYSVEATATLVAEPGAGHALSGWALSPGGLACQAAGETCMLAAGTAGPASAMAGFAAVRGALSLSVSGPEGANGWARAGLGGAEPLEARAGAGASTPTDVTALAGVELEAGSAAGYAFSGWTLSGGLSCAGGGPGSNPCRLEVDLTAAGSAFSAAAGFALSAATLTVTAGANGAVLAAVGGASGVRVGAGLSLGFPYSVEATATLVAEPGAGHALSGWALSPGGLACQAAGETCMLAAGTAGPASAMAGFAAVRGALSLSVSGPAGANGWARAGLGGAEPLEARAGAGASTPTDVTALAGVELEAGSAAGYAFSGWTLSGGLSCAGGGPGSNPCRLEVDLTAAGSAFSAAAGFALSAATLTVTAGANGAVLAAVGGASGVRVGAGLSLGFPYSVEATATLVAEPGAGHALSGWALSPGGLACQAAGETCMLAAGTAGPASAAAGFALRLPTTWQGPGSVSVSADGSTQTAVPYAQGSFDSWDGAPCDGSQALACNVSLVASSETLPVAVFRPFVVGGIKSLTFGLGYYASTSDHFSVSFMDAPDAGFTPVPSLARLDPDLGPARLAVPVHLLPWGLGAYLTEACTDSSDCTAASGGQWTLEQPDSVAATGYFKTPNAEANDNFGWALALSGDGATLAVGAPREDSTSTGVFTPGGDGYQTALDSNGGSGYNSGAVTVYYRSGSDGLWTLEAFVKAPRADDGDNFGWALALSDDGATLAVGAYREDSASTGTFIPSDDADYQTALDGIGAWRSGAAYVYRRSSSDGLWALEAFVKAPQAGRSDNFGAALALSDDGATLAVGAPSEESASTGAFAPGDDGYLSALGNNGAEESGAAYIYRRSGSDGPWAFEAFIKAPRANRDNNFGYALALSGDGATLAVGARYEDSAFTGIFTPDGDGYLSALGDGGAGESGAAYIYRHSGLVWRVEAFVKAPVADANDHFGWSIALSDDGDTLAVGARYEDSESTGTFTLGDQADQGALGALGNDVSSNSGAAYLYRYSGTAWGIEAFVKAPVADANDNFGWGLALSGDGATLAVGAPGEDSASAGVFARGAAGYQAALNDSGASISGGAYLYRRSGSAWSVKAFAKAPKINFADQFGIAMALSGDGGALAVGAYNEDGGALAQPVGGDSGDTRNIVSNAGAAYLY